jgi:hypothetical protein
VPRRLLVSLAVIVAATALIGAVRGATAERPDVPVLKERLQDILSTGYQLTEPPQTRLHDMFVRAMRSLRALLLQLSDTGPLAGLPEWVRPVLIGVLLVLLVLMAAHVVASLRGLLGEAQGRRKQRREERIRSDPTALLREAEDAFRRGDRDAAIGLLYHAVLLRLDRLGLLAHDPARTNWENLRAFDGTDPDARRAMAQLTREVDACVYGGRSASGDTWDRARGWAELLWQAEGPR